jgi:hypothetical protein
MSAAGHNVVLYLGAGKAGSMTETTNVSVGERADLLAALYLSDPAGFWRLAEMNDAMTAEVLSELREVLIPNRR